MGSWARCSCSRRWRCSRCAFREGRQLLFAGLLFVSTYFSNIGTRFLIPMVPFVSLAMALAVANLPWLLLLP